MRPSTISSASVLGLDPIRPLEPVAPPWVARVMAAPQAITIDGVHVWLAGDLALLETRVPGADALEPRAFREAVQRAYEAVGTVLGRIGRTAIRLWNYMPDPNEAMGDGLDRYMVFNEGRADGYRGWYAGLEAIPAPPTASAVGGGTGALVVHCFASTNEGRPIENPRQIPAWRYSRRYGPTPPRFSRAAIVTIDGRPQLLVGGTASIVGEDSQHIGDIAGQIGETLRNIATLVTTADPGTTAASALRQLRDVRAYVTRAEDAALVRSTIAAVCPRLDGVELALTPLCRPELLVEVEAFGDLTRPA